jgi:hypothetical protein
VVVRQYFMKKKIFGIKTYNLCHSLRYSPAYDMRAFTGNKRQDATADVSATHGTVMKLGRKV